MSLPLSSPAPAVAGVALEPLVAIVGGGDVTRRVAATLMRQGLEVIATVDAAEELEAIGSARHPHVVVLVSDGEEDGPAIRAITSVLPHSRVVLTLRDAHAATVRSALRAGADGVVLEQQLAMSLSSVVRTVSLGHAVVPLKDRSALGREPLSGREREVLALAAQGLTNAAIAARLCLAESTVKSHISSGFSKLGLHSRSELVTLTRGGRGRRGPGPRTTNLTGGTAA